MFGMKSYGAMIKHEQGIANEFYFAGLRAKQGLDQLVYDGNSQSQQAVLSVIRDTYQEFGKEAVDSHPVREAFLNFGLDNEYVDHTVNAIEQELNVFRKDSFTPPGYVQAPAPRGPRM